VHEKYRTTVGDRATAESWPRPFNHRNACAENAQKTAVSLLHGEISPFLMHTVKA